MFPQYGNQINPSNIGPWMEQTGGHIMNKVELGAIWELEVVENDVIAARSLMWEQHKRMSHYMPGFVCAGLTDDQAVALINRTTVADHDAISLVMEADPPEWPCHEHD